METFNKEVVITMIKVPFIKTIAMREQLQKEIEWLSRAKPPETLGGEIATLVNNRVALMNQIDETVESLSIDVPAEAEKYLPKEEVKEPIIKDPVEPISKG